MIEVRFFATLRVGRGKIAQIGAEGLPLLLIFSAVLRSPRRKSRSFS